MGEVDSLSNDDPDWMECHWYIAGALYQRFLDKGNPKDLNEAISRGMSVVERQGRSSATHLHDVALMILNRLDEREDPEDCAIFVELLENALEKAEEDGTDSRLIAECQANLATGLMEGAAADVPEPVLGVSPCIRPTERRCQTRNRGKPRAVPKPCRGVTGRTSTYCGLEAPSRSRGNDL